MLSSAEIFMKSYLWKYIDISINQKEREYIIDNSFYDPDIYQLFLRFENIFNSEDDIRYYVVILSSLNEYTYKRFMVYYMINASRYDKLDSSIGTKCSVSDVDKFIGNNRKRFLILLLSIHFYF